MNIPAAGWIREKALLGSGAIPVGRTKLRELVASGEFPTPRRFSARVVAYDCAAVHAWIEAQRTATPPAVPTRGTGSPFKSKAAATPAATA